VLFGLLTLIFIKVNNEITDFVFSRKIQKISQIVHRIYYNCDMKRNQLLSTKQIIQIYIYYLLY